MQFLKLSALALTSIALTAAAALDKRQVVDKCCNDCPDCPGGGMINCQQRQDQICGPQCENIITIPAQSCIHNCHTRMSNDCQEKCADCCTTEDPVDC